MRTIESDRFNCTNGERASFEAGIKLGSIFHQFIGTPVSLENISDIEKAMTSAMRTQPHVVDAVVKIDKAEMVKSLSGLEYCPLNDKMLRAEVLIDVKGIRCRAFLDRDEDLNYPLMWIGSVE